jgi:hypothetical protein
MDILADMDEDLIKWMKWLLGEIEWIWSSIASNSLQYVVICPKIIIFFNETKVGCAMHHIGIHCLFLKKS